MNVSAEEIEDFFTLGKNVSNVQTVQISCARLQSNPT